MHAAAEQPGSTVARQVAVDIVRTLRDGGFVAYLAGGCVRDRLLGLAPKDYDVATDALPDRVRRLFRGSRYVGEAFGVVLVRRRRVNVEVATFREEGGYEDGRRPTHVSFTDAQHDARRRDFTINGLFEDPLVNDGSPRVIDYVGGRADIDARVVRAIGDADQRFADDYLRMLRAVRFAARFGFAIEPATRGAIERYAARLGQISRERIGQEVLVMMQGPSPARAIDQLQALGLDGPTLNEPSSACALPTVEALEKGHGATTPIAAWLVDRHVVAQAAHVEDDHWPGVAGAFAKGELRSIVRRWRDALSLSNDRTEALRQSVVLALRAAEWPVMSVAQRKRLMARSHWPDAARLVRAMRHLPAHARLTAEVDADAAALIADGVAPPPWINGDDLIAMGLQPGPQFKRLLDAVYDAQLEHRVNSPEQARDYLRERLDQDA